MLEVQRDDGPEYLTVIEAGMLAKAGLNSSRVGLCTNTLVSGGDEGRTAVPYQLLLRSVLDSTSGFDSATRVGSADRANSANYLIVDDAGFYMDLETAPCAGGCRSVADEQGVITYANHFLSNGLTNQDRYLQRRPHSIDRLRNIGARLSGEEKLTTERVRATLPDHGNHPKSVCEHPDPSAPVEECSRTFAGVVLDAAARTMHVSAGNPCTEPWVEITL